MPTNAARKAAPVMLAPSAAPGEYDLCIYGDIDSGLPLWFCEEVGIVTDDSIVAQLAALPPSTTQLNVRINSYGGNVFAGMRIYNALKAVPINKVAIVEGVCMSAATLPMIACDQVQVHPLSMILIHGPVLDNGQYTAEGHTQAAAALTSIIGAVAQAYVDECGLPMDQVMSMMTDQLDHVFNGAEAVGAGIADMLIDFSAEPDLDEDQDDDAELETMSMIGLKSYLATLPAPVAQVAMRAAMSAKHVRLSHPAAPATPAPATTTGVITMPAPVNPAATANPAADTAATTAALQAQMLASVRARNEEITTALKPSMHVPAIRELYETALIDPQMTAASVNLQALAILGAQGAPAAGTRIDMHAGADEADKRREAGVKFLMARSGHLKGADDAAARQGNPFNGMTLLDMAKHCLMSAGRDIRGLNRDAIINMAITTSTDDYPVILENTLNKLLVNAYNQTESTWRGFSKVSTLSDFRPHNRYYGGSISDLKKINQNGEYDVASLGDAEKQQITGATKGLIINLSREVMINDDMSYFTDLTPKLGQTAARTVEKDVYALFALNGGFGPTMYDGYALFSSQHANIAGTAAAPSQASFDAARVQMGSQKDPSGNDYIGIRPSIGLFPLALGGNARQINGSQYDPDASGKFMIPSKVYGLLNSIIDSPRMTGTPWILFADPSIETVIEVGFLDGVQTPQLVSQSSFNSNGMAWRVSLDYGVAATGWRGAVYNAGA